MTPHPSQSPGAPAPNPETVTRKQIKDKGAVVIAYQRHGEVTEQVWRLPDGTLYRGHDWYHDTHAIVYPGPHVWYEPQSEDEWKQLAAGYGISEAVSA